jgi:hypothetical protein
MSAIILAMASSLSLITSMSFFFLTKKIKKMMVYLYVKPFCYSNFSLSFSTIRAWQWIIAADFCDSGDWRLWLAAIRPRMREAVDGGGVVMESRRRKKGRWCGGGGRENGVTEGRRMVAEERRNGGGGGTGKCRRKIWSEDGDGVGTEDGGRGWKFRMAMEEGQRMAAKEVGRMVVTEGRRIAAEEGQRMATDKGRRMAA